MGSFGRFRVGLGRRTVLLPKRVSGYSAEVSSVSSAVRASRRVSSV
jgi:hypothetical protein